jgi:hypothetical protein
MKTMAIGVMMIGVILACQNTTLTQQQDNNTIKNQENKQINRDGSIEKSVMPPIDVAAPTQTETATFALG